MIAWEMLEKKLPAGLTDKHFSEKQAMKKRIPLIPFILLAIWTVGCTNKQPAIVLDTSLDLGDVVNGEIVSRELTVHNEGTGPLLVDSVSTSCGCTKATLEPMTIEAGESGTLTVVFDSGAHGPDWNGEQFKQVFIFSNDPETPDTTIQVRANVLPPAQP